MEKDILLGTRETADRVYDAVRQAGFNERRKPELVFGHDAVDGLMLVIHGHPTGFREAPDIVTQVQVYSVKGEDLNTPGISKVLRDVYQEVPDFVYRRQRVFTTDEAPIKPLHKLVGHPPGYM